jgi:AcrR family transcriptional regulator
VVDRNQRDAGAARRSAGRPLDEKVDAAILDTAWRLLVTDGYARMSITQIAEEAGVGRPAIYRRYRNKSALVAAVIEAKRSGAPSIDTGSARGDLIAHLEFARRRFAMGLAGTLLVEEGKHPQLLKQFRNGMLVPRRDDLASALERGKARGDVRPDLDVNAAAEAVFGSFVYHYLVAGKPRRGWSERVIETLWPAFAATSRRPAHRRIRG